MIHFNAIFAEPQQQRSVLSFCAFANRLFFLAVALKEPLFYFLLCKQARRPCSGCCMVGVFYGRAIGLFLDHFLLAQNPVETLFTYIYGGCTSAATRARDAQVAA